MAKIIIFGAGESSQLAKFYLDHDSDDEVVAFSVHERYLPATATCAGLPVVAFERVEQTYSPAEFKFFAPLSPSGMNRPREAAYRQIKEKHYELISYVSSKATVLPGVSIGDNCFILEDNTLQPFTSIGNNVVLWSGNHIGHHGVIKDHVFFSSHVVLSGHCVVEPFSFFGVNASIRDHIHIAEGSFIAMGAAIVRDTEPWGVYRGNPATKARMASTDLKL